MIPGARTRSLLRAEAMARTWYENDALWKALSHTFSSPAALERAELEADSLVALAGLRAGEPALDLASGVGRLAIALARRGHPTTAVDQQAAFMTALARQAEELSLPVEVVRRDMRSFERKDAFSAAFLWGDSFGYFDAASDDRLVLAAAWRSLRPDGRLILQVTPKELAARIYPERTWSTLPGDRLLLEEHHITRSFTLVRHTWTLIEGASRQVFQGAQRLYSASEVGTLLREAGFEEVDLLGGLDRRSFGREAVSLVAVARR